MEPTFHIVRSYLSRWCLCNGVLSDLVCHFYFADGEFTMMLPKSQATRDGRSSSAFAVDIAGPARLGSGR